MYPSDDDLEACSTNVRRLAKDVKIGHIGFANHGCWFSQPKFSVYRPKLSIDLPNLFARRRFFKFGGEPVACPKL